MARQTNLKAVSARDDDVNDADRSAAIDLEAEFRGSLSAAQLEQYNRLCAGYHDASAEVPLKAADPSLHRERLQAAFAEIQTRITADKLEQLIDNAVEKGDASTLRLLALMAGLDLNTPAKESAPQGAQVILIKPHPCET